MKHKFYLFTLLTFLLTSSLSGCGPKPVDKDISIIYTTDVHCGLTDKLGYASVVDYKKNLEKNNYVALVDSGDFLQGDYVGAISEGKYIVDVMNYAKYDIATLGNHEFDYGIDVLSQRISEFHGDIVSCNVSYTGSHENKLNKVKPYVIKKYGNRSVGFVGITTPQTLTASNPKNFMEDDEIVYDFASSTVEHFFELVQKNIDDCKRAGADYIILLSHLGSKDVYKPYTSIELIEKTSGYIAVLDGHSHSDLAWTTEYKNKDGETVYLVDTGYKLNEFASFTIKLDGSYSYEYITEYQNIDKEMSDYITLIQDKVDELGNKVVANIDVDLLTTDENGVRRVRNRETPIGNLIADAYQTFGEADIGFVNGGGIRADLHKGDVTYKQIKDVHPYGNVLMTKRVSGQHILDYLEFASRFTQSSPIGNDGGAIGECGAFVSPSNLIYSIDTSIPSSVEVSSEGTFIAVTGPRRVKNVKVKKNNVYVDIDVNEEYVIASHDFLLENGGDGANMFINDPIVPSSQKFDYEVVIDYIAKILGGKLSSKYSTTEGRINIL